MVRQRVQGLPLLQDENFSNIVSSRSPGAMNAGRC